MNREDSEQSGRMPRLFRVFAYHIGLLLLLSETYWIIKAITIYFGVK